MYRLFLLIALSICAPCRAEWNYTTIDGAGGVPLSVVTAGRPDRPAILFVHGIGQSHYSFHKQLDSDLADEFYLVAFDLRGHGASGKPWSSDAYTRPEVWAQDVAAVMSATHIRRPVVVAWSYGTLVILDYVRQYGVGELAGLNLTGAIGALRPFRMAESGDPTANEFVRLREMQISPDLIENIEASRQMIPWLTAEPIPEVEQVRLESIALMFPAYARRAMIARRPDNQDLLDRLTLPTLISLGEKDNPASLEDATDIVAPRSNMALSIYEGAGHSVFYEQPERFNAELRRFARRAMKGAGPEAD